MKAGRKQAAEIGASRLQAGTGSIEQVAGRNWQQGKQRTWEAEAPARRGWTHRKKQAKQRVLLDLACGRHTTEHGHHMGLGNSSMPVPS